MPTFFHPLFSTKPDPGHQAALVGYLSPSCHFEIRTSTPPLCADFSSAFSAARFAARNLLIAVVLCTGGGARSFSFDFALEELLAAIGKQRA